MKLWVVAVAVLVLVPSSGGLYGPIPHSFFVDPNGYQNCLIVVGEQADASDIIEASRLAVTLGNVYTKKTEVPVVEEVSVSYKDVKAGTCIVLTPLELSTLWYFDDFGVYGNGNEKFNLWETHEEIQLYIDDMTEVDPLSGIYKQDGYLDFSTIYRIDNVRSPPYVWVDSYTEGVRGQHITGFQYQEKKSYGIIHPFFVYSGYLPEIVLFDTVYTVVYIDAGVLVTGVPHLEYVYVYEDTPFEAGDFTISLLDVDVDYNKCWLQVAGSGTGESFWMVLDPLHGFSPDIQEMGSDIFFDFDKDGVVDYSDKTVVGESELDVWGHALTRGIADLVIDGIKIFIGEEIGVYLGVYWVEDAVLWNEKTCCDPFVKYPQFYDFQIRPETVTSRAVEDAYVDQVTPSENCGGLSFLSARSLLNANTRSFVRFDLPELPEKAIISKATLRLTPSSLSPRVYEVSRVSTTWNELSITWNNQPGAVLTGTQINNTMEWDVTPDVVDFYNGTPNYGWRISDQSENSAVLYETLFDSRESGMKPQLTIEYTLDCNCVLETIPHTKNWINTFYDDVTGDGILDPVYEIDISLCEPIKTVCDPLFFEGPNYYYFVDFWNTSFEDGVDFRVYQTNRVGAYTVEEIMIDPWELIKLDVEITEKDAVYNWILIGGYNNTWVKNLVDGHIKPDDGRPVDWFAKEPGYNMYSDPFGYVNKVLVVAGKTAKDTQKAIKMLIEDITS
jgi:hypothetical protein